MTADATSRTIRSTGGIVWLVVVAAGVAVLFLDVLVRGDLRQTLLISDGSWGIFFERTTSVVLPPRCAMALVPML